MTDISSAPFQVGSIPLADCPDLCHKIISDNPPFTVSLIRYPSDSDWLEVKRRALVTINKRPVSPPSLDWKHSILKACHSPIRYLMFSFSVSCPSYVATHLARHVHIQPYISTQRTDRTPSHTSRHTLPQDNPVQCIFDMNADALITLAQKRLCKQADPVTRACVCAMSTLVIETCPEFDGLLQPICKWYNGCPEMFPCGKEPVLDI